MKKLNLPRKVYFLLLLLLAVTIVSFVCMSIQIVALVSADARYTEEYVGAFSFYRTPLTNGTRYVFETENGKQIAVAVNGSLHVQEYESVLAQSKTLHIRYLKTKDLLSFGKHLCVFLADENQNSVLLTQEDGIQNLKGRITAYAVGGCGSLFLFLFVGSPVFLIMMSENPKYRRFVQRIIRKKTGQGTVLCPDENQLSDGTN